MGRISKEMIIRKATIEDMEALRLIYEEFLMELDNTPDNEKIDITLKNCLEKGFISIAIDKKEIIAIAGGCFYGKIFHGNMIYIKPEYRNYLYKFLVYSLREIKKEADCWQMLCAPKRLKLWMKVGFDVDKVLIRRAL